LLLIKHSTIKSSIYELIKTIEFDVEIGDDGFSLRLELFQSLEDSKTFRVHLWRTEFYRIQSTFPQESGTPKHEPSDELIWIDWSTQLQEDYNNFQAENAENAVQLVLDEIRKRLVHTTASEE
jgi:hypothetical protein